MRVAVTGANGFVGQALLRRLKKSGCGLITLTRGPFTDPAGGAYEWMRYSLEEGLKDDLPEDCDTVIHCAYAMAPNGTAALELNVKAARALQAAAGLRRFVFISSMSAHADARSAYGRGKWAIEGMLRQHADLAIKPGFVIGPGGIFGRLRRSISRLPFVPLFYGGHQPIQTIWVEDLAEAVARAVERRITGTLTLGCAEAITLREFYRAILVNDRLRRPLVPVPGGMSLVVLRLLEKLGIALPVSSENLLGLVSLRRFETRPSLDRLDLGLVDLNEALRRTRAMEQTP